MEAEGHMEVSYIGNEIDKSELNLAENQSGNSGKAREWEIEREQSCCLLCLIFNLFW